MPTLARLLQLACLTAILAPAQTQNATEPFANITCAVNISELDLCSLPEPAEEQCGELCATPPAAEEQCSELCATPTAIEDTCDDLCPPSPPPPPACNPLDGLCGPPPPPACIGILCAPPPPPACNDILCALANPPPAPVGCGIDALCGPLPDEIAPCNDILCAPPSPPPADAGCGNDALCGPLPDDDLVECIGMLCTPPSPPPLTCLIDVFEAQCGSPPPFAPPPKSPPPLPPFRPASTTAPIQTVITFTAVVPGTIATFDQEGFKAALARTMANQGVTASMIRLRVEAASVRVTSQIIDPPNAAAVFNRLTVVTASAQTLSNALGVPIASIAQAPVTARVQASAPPSAPPPSPVLSPPPTPATIFSAIVAAAAGLSTGGAIAIGVVLGSVVLLASCIFYYVKYGRKGNAPKQPSPAKKETLSADKKSKDTVISSSAVDVEMAGGRTASDLDVKPKDDAPGSIPPSSPTSEEGAPANAPEGSSIELTEIKRSPPTELPIPENQSRESSADVSSEISNRLASFFNPFSPKSPATGREDVHA